MSIQSVILYTTASHEYRVPQLRYFAKGLRDAGFDTTVAGPLGPSCTQELQQLGVHVRLKPQSQMHRRLKLYNGARLLDVALDRNNRYDLAIGIGSAGLALAYLAYRMGRACHLGAYFLEYDPPACYRGQFRHYPHLITPKLATKLDILIDVNNERLQQRREWMFVPERSAVLLNVPPRDYVSEDPARENASIEVPLHFLYQGTLGSSNGLKLLFESFKEVKHERYTLTLAGHAEDPEALSNQIRAYFPAGNVSYSGLLPRTELPEFISRHHVGIALYPWRHDKLNPGFELCAPNKLYEYLARGLPVVCSDNASLRFVEDQKIGWQINPDNSHQLADLIGTLCRERKTVKEYGDKALALSRSEWNFEHQFAPIAELIRQIQA